jgi:hypothetical protein
MEICRRVFETAMQTCKSLALQVEVKNKAVPLQAMKGYMLSTGVSLLILNLDSRLCEWSASRLGRFASGGRASGAYTRLVGPQSLAGRLLKYDKGLFPLQAIELRTMQPVAYIMGVQICQKSSSHLRILVARKVT